MNKLKLTRSMAWVPLVVSFLSLAGFAILYIMGCRGQAVDQVIYLPAFATGVGFSILGLIILRHRPENRIGWLALATGILFPLVPVAGAYTSCTFPAGPFVSWVNYILPWPIIGSILIALPLLFPDGRFLSSSWRRMAGVIFGLLIVLGFLVATLPGPMQNNGMGSLYPYNNPLALPLLPVDAAPILAFMMNILLIFAILGANLSFVDRWRQSKGETRQQLKWLAYFLGTAVTIWCIVELYGKFVNSGIYTALNGWPYSIMLLLVFIGYPLIIGFVVFKYRLYDIDVIIRKTLVYGSLTAVLALVYFGTVVVLQSLVGSLTGEESPVVIVVSTLLIAALFTPLRRKVQEVIDRRFFRQKYNGEQVLARFGRTARNEVELEKLTAELVAVVEETMRPDNVSVWLKQASMPGRTASWLEVDR